ncbi:hypothetical protein [Actinomadura terrae]|uniref:hypothetical protein n=1 Tax=Actinomadura terrae TaxID=604353 RepID=UPI001FA757A3|nr:hypothetical protein [Actinomadura terrae]
MAAPVGQSNWRFCSKCFGLWYNGLPTNGVCPAGGSHQAFASSAGPASAPAAPQGGPGSWDYLLAADPAVYPNE